MAEYTEMWQSLGLNMEAHENLLQVLGKAYEEVFLSQEDRPKGMEYFDFFISEIHGLRIKELLKARSSGRVVVGTFCLYVPEELILAVDGIPVGLCAGGDIGTEKAEELLPRNTCALIKSFFGFKLSGVCPYVEASDLVIGETTCDGKKKAYELFSRYKPTFVMEVPHTKSPAAKRLWRSELDRLAGKLEELSGKEITTEALRASVRTVNAKRRAIHRLNALRGVRPAPISGRDALLINQIQFFDDPERFTEKLNLLYKELQQRARKRTGVGDTSTPRILVSGCPMAAPNWKVPYLVEKHGAVIVGEESCVGERGTRNLVEEGGETRQEIMDRIAYRYLSIDCACFTPNDERLGHIIEMVQNYKADAVLHYALQFCMPYTIEAARVEKALGDQGIPLLKVETDYSMEDVPQLETRIQAFLETLR